MNPRVGSRAQQTCRLVREEAVKVGKNHEGGPSEGWQPRAEGSERRGNVVERSRERTSSETTDGGAFFGQP
jgi:hypothetical protein